VFWVPLYLITCCVHVLFFGAFSHWSSTAVAACSVSYQIWTQILNDGCNSSCNDCDSCSTALPSLHVTVVSPRRRSCVYSVASRGERQLWRDGSSTMTPMWTRVSSLLIFDSILKSFHWSFPLRRDHAW